MNNIEEIKNQLGIESLYREDEISDLDISFKILVTDENIDKILGK